MIDDKHLANALRLLASSNAYDVQSVPVVNAERKGEVVLSSSSGNVIDMFVAQARKHKWKSIDREGILAFLTGSGFSKGTFSYFVRKAIEAKVLVRRGQEKVWEVRS